MTVAPDVRGVAAHFGLDPQLIQAVVQAEGDIVAAVRCSIPSVTTREQALQILCRSAVHALSDYVRSRHAGDFVQFWRDRWAPLGATNDPKRLNQFWVKNVLSLWLGATDSSQNTQATAHVQDPNQA